MITTSKPVTVCQSCGNKDLKSILFLGYLPPVNQMHDLGTQPVEQPSYPAELLYCNICHLVQLGLVVNKEVLFPPEYPYTSSTTKVLRDNFADLYDECLKIIQLKSDDLVIDIGSNDGNLLSNFQNNHRVLGVTPEEIGKLAIERGIQTIINYFTENVVEKIKKEHGRAKLITATNVYAHIDNVNKITELIIDLLENDGIFISESHYLLPLINTLQYDTIYHEHLRYYSLHSLKYLFEKHGLEIFNVKEIPSHGGSIRIYCALKGNYEVNKSVNMQLKKELDFVVGMENFNKFRTRVILSKLKLHKLLFSIKENGEKICAVGAPSRGSTLVNFAGLDKGIIDYVCEIKGSHKIGKYLPGTLIPVVEEQIMFEEQPSYALFLSWHIADDLIPVFKRKNYKGKFIIPLPEPRIIK
tara:strand:- start:262 stop:1500 length:1239 start_codon:yes stop_codon:yes gene_type:complete